MATVYKIFGREGDSKTKVLLGIFFDYNAAVTAFRAFWLAGDKDLEIVPTEE